MKTRLLKCFAALLLACLCLTAKTLYGQTASFAALSSGLSTGTIPAGTSQAVLIGFKVQVSGGGITFRQFNIGSDLQNVFANGTLYRSPTSSFSAGNPGTPVGNVTFSGNNVTVDNFSETITNTTNYYFLVVDVINTNAANGNVYINTPNFAVDGNGNNNYVFYNNNPSGGNTNTYFYYSLTAGTPYPVRIANVTTGLAPTSTIITSGSGGLALFGFAVTTSASRTFNNFNINSNLSNLSAYFTNFKLYYNNAATFVNAMPVANATATVSGSYVKFSGLSEAISSTTRYYFLVADCLLSGSTAVPVNLQFNFSDGQTDGTNTVPAAVSGGPTTNYNTFTLFGNTYNVNSAAINVSSQQNGLTAGTIYSGQTGIAIFGFGLSAASGSSAISQININSSYSSIGTYFSNAKLYSCSTNNYSTGTKTLLGSGTFNGSFVNFSGLAEGVSATEKYYFLVLDNIYPGTGTPAVSFNFTSGQSSSALIQSNPSSSYNNFSVAGNTFTMAQPTLSVSQQTGGIAATTINYGQTDAPVLGFSINVTGITTIGQINLQVDNNTNTPSSLVTAKLYRSASGTFSSSSPGTVVGTVNFSGNNVTITGLSEAFTSGQTNYYFLVITDIYGSYTTSDKVRFYLNSASTILNSGGGTISSYNGVYSSAFTLNTRAVGYTITDANTLANGITQGPISPGQTGAAIFGYGISSNAAATISGFMLNSAYLNGNPQFYFTNGKVYSSTSSVFSTSTATLTSGSVAFGSSTSPGITVTGLNQTIGSTPVYYFIVADLVYNYNTVNATSATIQFKFETSQTNAITQTAPVSANIAVTSAITGTNYTINPPTISLTGFNGVANGITQGTLSYGETNIVFFGFRAAVTGLVTINEIDIPSNINPGQYFTNGRLYRSADQYFSHATLVPGTINVTFNNPTVISGAGLNETLTSGTPYYYFLVADFTFGTSFSAPTTLQYNFANGTTSIIQSSPYRTFNTASTTNGAIFNIINTYNWTGSTSSDFSDANNFRTLNGGGVSTPGATVAVRIGGVAYTNAPVINANTAIGGITFSSANVANPTLTIAPGKTLTLNTGMVLVSGAKPTVTGGTLALAGGSVSNMASTSVLTLGAATTLANSGTFTLRSDAGSSAAIAAIPAGSFVTGSFNVERFITGGSSSYRGYRLLSSPVASSASSGISSLAFVNTTMANNTSSGALTGGPGGAANGFTVANGNPTMYLYNENNPSSTTSYTAGKSVGIVGISGTTLSTLSAGTTSSTTLPLGNGFMLYFIGNNANTTVANTRIPENTTITSTGYINQGDVQVKPWFNSTSTSLSYNSTVNTTAAKCGYNLVGNPYPSTIDLNAVSTANPVFTVFYELNNTSHQYDSYSTSTGGTGKASQYIASGQAFFVKTTAADQTLKFTESQKIPAQQLAAGGAPYLLESTPNSGHLTVEALNSTGTSASISPLVAVAATQAVKAVKLKGMHIKIRKDSVTNDDCGIYFGSKWTDNYDSHDAIDIDGVTPKVYMSSYTADSYRTAINLMADFTKTKKIKLYANADVDGLYHLDMTDLAGIDTSLYNIFLLDKYKKDSLDMRRYKTYNFNIIKSDTNSFGGNRFVLAIERIIPVHPYKFVSVSAKKAVSAIAIKWTTLYEQNDILFVVEKQTSITGKFTALHNLQSSSISNYSYTDNSPANGANVYRIKQTNGYGEVSYSPLVSVVYAQNNTNATSLFNVYPNPAVESITVNVTEAEAKSPSYKLNIYDTSGLLMMQKTANQDNFTQNVARLQPGIYVVELQSNEGKPLGKTKFLKVK